jgi:hypothetical protein
MGGAKQATTSDFMLKAVDDELPANVTRASMRPAPRSVSIHMKEKA